MFDTPSEKIKKYIMFPIQLGMLVAAVILVEVASRTYEFLEKKI